MPPRVGHVHLKVSDLDRSEAFYRDVLGLGTTERLGDTFAFMSWGAEHHDLALQGHPGAPRPHPGALGLYHFAVEVDDEAALGEAVSRLHDNGVHYSAVDHGISKAVYFSDPDGHGIEIYCDTRDRRDQWGGMTEPLDVTTLG
jgi:catechol 2,3-dioxygenase